MAVKQTDARVEGVNPPVSGSVLPPAIATLARYS